MPRRSEGTGPWYRDVDDRWEAQYVDARGRTRSVYGHTEAEAKRNLRDALNDRDGGVSPDSRTVGDWIDRWLASLRPTDKRATTRADYEYRLSLIPRWVRRKRLDELDPMDVEDMLAELIDRGGSRSQGLATSTVAKVRTVLAQALKQAVKYGLVARNVAALTDPVKVTEPDIDYLTLDEAKALIGKLSGHRLESLYLVAVTAGLRQSELIGLKWGCVDLDAGTVRVEVQRTRTRDGDIVVGDPKSRSSARTIALADIAADALRGWKVRLAEERLALGEAWADHRLVWPSTVGTPLGHRNLLRHLYTTCENAGIRRVSFHTLRHSAATIMLAAGVDSRVIMDQLGHSDPRMVARYQHVIDEVRHGAADKVDGVWRGEAPSEAPSDEGATVTELPNHGS